MLWWDAVIIFFALFNAICIPLDFGFADISEVLNESIFYTILNYSSYFFFLIDIVIACNTSYFNSDGEEIIEKRAIIINYMQTTFIVDILSTFPFEFVSDVSVLLTNIL